MKLQSSIGCRALSGSQQLCVDGLPPSLVAWWLAADNSSRSTARQFGVVQLRLQQDP